MILYYFILQSTLKQEFFKHVTGVKHCCGSQRMIHMPPIKSRVDAKRLGTPNRFSDPGRNASAVE